MGFRLGQNVVTVLIISWPLLVMFWTKALTFSTEALTVAWLHTHGGFLCQIWFCTFTLWSLLSLSTLQPWFCSQGFSRACRTSCVLELSAFGCGCQDASNKKNYWVARSKQIKKQLSFTQWTVRFISLSIVWKWTSVKKQEYIHEII